MTTDLFCSVKLRIEGKKAEEPHAFGPGTARLLEGVSRLSSLNKAAKEMEMAYSKAWKLIRAAEADLGFDLIERKARDGSAITENGKKLLVLYHQVQQAAQEAAAEALKNSDIKFD
jgi:molybdate transport system regulatory protein